MSDIGFQVSQLKPTLVSKYLSGHNSPSDSNCVGGGEGNPKFHMWKVFFITMTPSGSVSSLWQVQISRERLRHEVYYPKTYLHCNRKLKMLKLSLWKIMSQGKSGKTAKQNTRHNDCEPSARWASWSFPYGKTKVVWNFWKSHQAKW